MDARAERRQAGIERGDHIAGGGQCLGEGRDAGECAADDGPYPGEHLSGHAQGADDGIGQRLRGTGTGGGEFVTAIRHPRRAEQTEGVVDRHLYGEQGHAQRLGEALAGLQCPHDREWTCQQADSEAERTPAGERGRRRAGRAGRADAHRALLDAADQDRS